jgi:transmembrane sensor
MPHPDLNGAIDAELLDRYLASECTAEEVGAVQRWLSADSSRERLLQTLTRLPARPGAPPPLAGGNPDRAWRGLVTRIDLHGSHTDGSSRVSRPRGPHSATRQVSALWYGTILGVACLAAALFMLGDRLRFGVGSQSSRNTAVTTYMSKPGERLGVTLHDGTRVTLAPASTMTVDGRTVTLLGQALFTVTHHDARPFIVRSGDVTTRVLGTVFGVQAYADDPVARVVVAEGRVAVGATVLSNGDIATVAASRVDVRHDAERVAAWTAFAQGTLVVDAQTLAEAAPQIGRWLGIHVRVEGAAASRQMSITLRDQSVREVFDLISMLTHTDYTQRGDTVSFRVRE